MKKPRYSSAASQDLTQVMLHIAENNSTAALKWIDKIESKCLLIAQNPELGELRPEFGDCVRSFAAGRYVIFYRIVDENAEILRVLAGERDIRDLAD